MRVGESLGSARRIAFGEAAIRPIELDIELAFKKGERLRHVMETADTATSKGPGSQDDEKRKRRAAQERMQKGIRAK